MTSSFWIEAVDSSSKSDFGNYKLLGVQDMGVVHRMISDMV